VVSLAWGAGVVRGDVAAGQTSGSDVLVHIAELKGAVAEECSPFSADGARFVTVENHMGDCTLLVWDTGSWKLHARPIRQRAVITQRLTSNGTGLFTETGDGQVGIWDVETSALRSVVRVGEPSFIAKCAPDGSRYFTRDSRDVANLQLWRPGDTKPFVVLEHSDGVTFAAFDAASARIVTREWAKGAAIHLWDAKTGLPSCAPIETDFIDMADDRQVAAFDASGKRLVFARRAGFSVADTITGKILARGDTKDGAETHAIRLSGDGSTVAVLTDNKWPGEERPIQIFESATGKFIRSAARSTIFCELSATGRWLFCGIDRNSTEVWDLSNGLKVQTVPNSLGVIALSPNGRTLAISHDSETSIWRVRDK